MNTHATEHQTTAENARPSWEIPGRGEQERGQFRGPRGGRRGAGRRGFRGGPWFGQQFGQQFGPGFGFQAGPGRRGGGFDPEEPEEFEGPGRGFGPGGFGPGGFGPGGFGPGGFGPGGFGPGGPGGFGRGGHGHGPGRGWGGRRRGRGNVRAAVLALLNEEPRHGYSIMTELAERSGGTWRPSPGSVYPVLQQLQDEGLVSVEEADGRRVFSLTEAGRRLVAENPAEFAEPWAAGDRGPGAGARRLFETAPALFMAAREVARTGDEAQIEAARAVLDEARKALYRILAGDAPGPEAGGETVTEQ